MWSLGFLLQPPAARLPLHWELSLWNPSLSKFSRPWCLSQEQERDHPPAFGLPSSFYYPSSQQDFYWQEFWGKKCCRKLLPEVADYMSSLPPASSVPGFLQSRFLSGPYLVFKVTDSIFCSLNQSSPCSSFPSTLLTLSR